MRKIKIIKTILIIIAVWIVLNILLLIICAIVSDDTSSTDYTDSSVSDDTSSADYTDSSVSDSIQESSKWIKSYSEIIEGSGIYFAYDMNYNDFIDSINANFDTIAKQGNLDIGDFSFDYSDTLKQNGFTTYTFSASNDIFGYYIDTTEAGIIQVRPVISYGDLVNQGYSFDNVMSLFSLQVSLALSAYEIIDVEEIDSLWQDLKDNIINEGNYQFYKDGIVFRINYDDTLIQCSMFKVDDNQYDELKELCENSDTEIVEL